MEKFLERFLINQILKTISDINVNIDNLQNVNGTMRTTRYLNIAHGIGKYYAFMECLEEFNLDKPTRMYDLTKQKIDCALKTLEEIYQYMRQ